MMNRIALLRKQRGLTQGDVARSVGCSQGLISMVENYQTTPRFPRQEVRRALAALFETPYEKLVQPLR